MSGVPVIEWRVRNPEADLGAVYDLFRDGKWTGYMVVEDFGDGAEAYDMRPDRAGPGGKALDIPRGVAADVRQAVEALL